MSDDGGDIAMQNTDALDREIDDEENAEVEEARNEKEVRRNFEDEDEEEDEERADYDDDDDDEEDEDDEEDSGRPKKKSKHRHKKPAWNKFLDVEAEVDEEEDEDEDEEEYGRDEFIADPAVEGEDDEGRRAANHARLDRREREYEDVDAEVIAQNLKARYGRAAVRYTGDMNQVPQRLLMPSVHDANLWQVRVKPGRERDLVFSLMRKAIDLEYTARPLGILSAFQRDSLPGMIYVEAKSQQSVSQACNGLVGIYPSRGYTLVPIDEMASLLQIKKQDVTVTPGSWVRIRRGKYQGDLAQVLDSYDNGEDVGLRFIPRIDFSPRDDASLDGRKRKKGGTGPANVRPPQGLFNYEEVIKVYGRKQVSKRNQIYVFQQDDYKDGFIEKDFKISALSLEDVNPTLDEISQFTRNQDGEAATHVDLSIIAEASRKAAVSVLQPGDHVEVFEGEQSGVQGVVESINQDVVTITAIGVDIDGQKVDVPARSVRKKFKAGDHVKVMTGKNSDETGLVVNVEDNIVTFLSDMSMNEVSVFSKDLREAAEVGSSTNIVGNYELHDLVQLDLQTVGVIYKTERDSFRVLDQNGQVRLVQPHQISMRRDSNRAIATDSEGHELRIHDNMKEVDGEGRKGTVLHIHQSFFAFLHNRDIVENGGVFVTRARSLVSLAPKGSLIKTAGMDLTKMNPAMTAPGSGGLVGSGGLGRGPRDRLIGVTVTIVKGPNKGYVGIIKDTNGPIARVELHTGSKVITIEKEKLRRRNPNGTLEPLERPGGGNFGNAQMTNHGSGGRTPAWGGPPSRTPNPYAEGGKTPAWNAASRTPNPYADSGKTPAWNASSRTPNPYAQDGGRTPAWNASARTPNPYASGGGAATGGWGGATPKPTAGAWGDSSWGGGGGSSPGWSGGASAWSAPTPGATSAPTPGSAPTPAAAPTPGISNYWAHDTPAWGAAGGSAQTPASAPTPGAPGVGASMYDANGIVKWTPEKYWLIEPCYKNKRVIVEITGNEGTKWNNGEHNGTIGYVTSIFDPRNNSVARTATVIPLSANHNKDSELTVPIEYLMPVHPSEKNDIAVVMEGQRKGTSVILREKSFHGEWVVGKTHDTLTMAVHEEKMVKAFPEGF